MSGTATVLFTDLVGSTELLSDLGEAAFDDLRRAHFAILREAIERHDGEEIKTLGDGVLAVFGSASDAVRCAVAMQQAVDRQARSRPAPLAIRVGLAVGDVTFEEDDVFGTPVVEAARLVAVAGASQILATALVRAVGGARSQASFTDVGPLSLKGLPEPVAACEVTWEALVVPWPPPAPLLTDVGPIFVGRDGELHRLTQLWKEAVGGERRIVLLAGEPGVGKTRLAAELAGISHAEGATVLAGRCDEDLGVPYQPFVEALRYDVDHAPVDGLARRLGRYGGELVRLVPEVVERVPGFGAPLRSDPETERYRLFDAVAGWLAAASAESPVLLVLDDLQWAAKPTLLLLRHVVRSAEPFHLLVIGTYRDTELGHDHPLVEILADLRRQSGVERFSLLGLDQAGVADYVERAAGRTLDEDDLLFAGAIYEETEGNPFFVREVLRHLAETGAVERRGDGWATRRPVDELGIPEGVREVVGRRLAHLSESAHQILRTAAVAGTEFEVPVLQAAGSFAEEDVLSALEEASAARLVIEASGTRYRFAHALVRHTLYEGLSAARRPTLHRRVAVAIEAVHAGRLDDHLPALAHHHARASVPTPDTGIAAAYAIRAGDRALTQLAHDEAATYYGQALELLDLAGPAVEAAQRLDLLLALGEAQRRAGLAAHRETLLAAAALAADLGDADRLARAALANSRGSWTYTMGVDRGKVAVLEAALEAIPLGDSPSRARLLANLGQEVVFAGGGDRHLALTAEALAMAHRLGDTATLAHVLVARNITLLSNPALIDEWLADSAELLALAEELGDPQLRVHATFHRFGAAFQSGIVDEADRALDSNDQLAAESGQPYNRWWHAVCRAGRVLAAGRIAEAETIGSDALEIGLSTGQPDARQFYAALHFDFLFESGHLEEDLDRLVEAVQHSDRPVLRAMLCLTYSELGRDDDARRALETLVPTLADLILVGPWFRTVIPAVATSCRLGDADTASLLFDLLLPYADLIAGTTVGWSGSTSHYLGMLATVLGRFDEAERFFATAEDTHARIPAPTWLARTRLESARMLLARQIPEDVDRARGLLNQALETARELGLAQVERDVVTLLERL